MSLDRVMTSHDAGVSPARAAPWQIACLVAGMTGGCILGFLYGPGALGGLAYVWSEWLLPAFLNMYLAGIALCT